MSHLLPPEQQAIRAKCFHPSGAFSEFEKEEIEQSIPERFEKMVAQYPERIAVKTKNSTFTYEAFNRMANRIAWAILEKRGEGQESVVLLLDRDTTASAAIFGVLKAGKIYVQLDPNFPPARITHMFEDSRSALVVTHSKNLSLAKELAGNGRLLLNIDELDANLPTVNPGLSISPDALRQIRYTSGSTGQPKGVLSNHRMLLFSTMNYTNNFHICPEDRINDKSSSIFPALLNGASFYPLDIKEEGLSGLAERLMQEEITIHCSVPSVFRHFLSTLTGEEKFPDLRLIHLEGEAISKSDVQLYKRHFCNSCILVNNLGSGEAGALRQYFMDKDTRIEGDTVPVGYAVEGKEVLLLDENGQELGFDQVGEIAIKSKYLSSGYWQKPELTKAKFLPDPAGGDERIYLTGDLGRMLPDGCLEYLGRKDFQVKVRGNKVEPAEVEMALLNLDTIKEAVVVAKRDEVGDHCLVAYVVPKERPAPKISILRRTLAEKLPDYMVPSAFVVMGALPLLHTGKVDRRGLPPPGRTRPELEVPFTSPRTPVEVILARIWAEVLGLDQVGIHDSFLDLGGHSLLATRIISRVINEFQVVLPIQSLFQSPTVADMAAIITQNKAKKLDQEDLTRILAELESLSDEEAKEFAARESVASTETTRK